MVVYGHRSFELEPRRFLAALRTRVSSAGASPAHDVLLECLVDIGEAEAAVADAVMHDADVEADELTGWREIAGSIAAAACSSRYGDVRDILSALHRARCGIERVLQGPLPETVRARTAEGFACYSLYPEQYMSAAEQIAAHADGRTVFCLGLRSIGSILAHVVAATLQHAGVPAIVRSARPRGHPFDRQLRIDRSFAHAIESAGCDLYAVIDEGPGLSGSSFAAAAEQLLALGIKDERIVLVPAWNADPARLKSDRGRRTWEKHRRYIGTFDAFARYRRHLDCSAGRWRSHALGCDPHEWPAVQPQHERPKFVDTASGRIARFAGVGKTAPQRRARAEVMHDAGFGPSVTALHNGVLELTWIDGRPARTPSIALLNEAARYLAFIKSRLSLGKPDDVEELTAMIDVNSSQAGLPLDVQHLSRLAVSAGTGRVAIDGRMMPHEWIQTGSRVVKIDALDHHDDDFFAGCRDVAWDVAGMCVEWALDSSESEYFTTAYRRSSGDVDIQQRLPFYIAAYAAYRLGYARLAAESVSDTAEACRFKRLEMAYADRLRRFQRGA